MGYKYTGDSVLGVSLTVNTPKPLDVRTVVENTSELYSIPKNTAYKGMTVAVISNGNIYMLVGDQLNPANPVDPSVPQLWRASYEAIQIVTCTQSEYEEWKNNTDNYAAIDPDKPYLREDVYYYIYEDSIDNLEDQAYVSYSLLQDLTNTVINKADSSYVQILNETLTKLDNKLSNEYTNTLSLIDNYASLVYINELINTENKDSFISNILNKYYTSADIDSKFVTQEWLKGNAEGTDFVFVTKTEYDSDLNNIQTLLESTLKTEEDGSVKNLTVEMLTSSKENLNIQTNELQINFNKVALSSEVPLIETLEQSEYDNKLKLGELKDDVYYCTYSDKQKDGIVTNSILEEYCYSKAYINELISGLEKTILDLTQRIINLETV